jgi:hypothetical protein
VCVCLCSVLCETVCVCLWCVLMDGKGERDGVCVLMDGKGERDGVCVVRDGVCMSGVVC